MLIYGMSEPNTTLITAHTIRINILLSVRAYGPRRTLRSPILSRVTVRVPSFRFYDERQEVIYIRIICAVLLINLPFIERVTL